MYAVALSAYFDLVAVSHQHNKLFVWCPENKQKWKILTQSKDEENNNKTVILPEMSIEQCYRISIYRSVILLWSIGNIQHSYKYLCCHHVVCMGSPLKSVDIHSSLTTAFSTSGWVWLSSKNFQKVSKESSIVATHSLKKKLNYSWNVVSIKCLDKNLLKTTSSFLSRRSFIPNWCENTRFVASARHRT